MIRRLLAPIVQLRENETTITLWMFAYSFFAMTAYNIIKPATRSKFIASLGAENLPYVMLAAGLLMGVVMQAYSRLVDLLPRRWVFPGTQAALAMFLLAFWALFKTGQPWVPAAFYFWGLLLGIFLISQFWTVANDIYDARQAKRLFGFIGGGASLGGVTGAGLTALLASRLGTDNLLLLSAALLAMCASVVWHVTRPETFGQSPARRSEAERERVTSKEALRLLRDSRQLQTIAVVIGCAAMGAVIVEQQLNMATEAAVGAEDAITSFLARITLYISLIGFLVQVLLTSRIQRRLGVGFTLLILPAGLGVTALVTLFNPVLWVPAFARVQDSSLRYTLDKTTREILFLPLPPALKHKAKPFVDVAVDRLLGKGLGSIVLLVLLKVFHWEWYQLSYISLPLAVVWVVSAMWARREYVAGFRRSLERQELTTDDARLVAADLSTVETLVRELARPEEQRVLHAIDLLEALEKRDLVTPLLLRHSSPAVRTRVLDTLMTGAQDIGPWLATIEGLLRDESPEVRGAAAALAAGRGVSTTEFLRSQLHDPDPRVVAAASMALGRSTRQEDVEVAERALSRIAEDTRAGAESSQREVARTLAQIPDRRFRPLLARLVRDVDAAVAREAIRTAARFPLADDDLTAALISLLQDRRLKAAARHTLASYGDPVLVILAREMLDSSAHPWVGRHIPATVALIPGQAAVDILAGALSAEDGFLRFKALESLERIRREHPEVTIDRPPVEALALADAERHRHYRDASISLFAGTQGPPTLLSRALEDKVRRTMDRMLRTVGLVYPWNDIAAARWTLEHGDARARASAVEYLDNLLTGRIRTQLMPLIEQYTLDEHAPRSDAPAAVESDAGVQAVLRALAADEDTVIAATAVDFGRAHHVPGFIEGSPHPSIRGGAEASAAGDPLALVGLVRGLLTIPLFDASSLNELFRIAELARPVRYEAGQPLFDIATPATDIVVVLAGRVALTDGASVVREVQGPGLLSVREALVGAPHRCSGRAVEPLTCLALDAAHFRALLSNNVGLIHGVFRTVLGHAARDPMPIVLKQAVARGVAGLTASEVTAPEPVHKVLLLRDLPLFARATPEELMDLAAVCQTVPLTAGALLVREYDHPSLYVVLSGEVLLEPVLGGDSHTASAGDAIGIYEPLSGVASGWRGRVARDGVALRLQRDDLIELLADRVELLQGVFIALLESDRFRDLQLF